MAKNLGGQPWVFDAAAQGYARDATSTRGNANSMSTRQKIFVTHIVFESAATGGTYEVTAGNGGVSLGGPQTLGANAEKTIVIDQSVEGIYIKSFGSDGTISVFHGVA